MTRILLACVFLIGLPAVALAQDASQVTDGEQPTKNLLTPSSFGTLHALIQPEVGEYRWDEIHWLASIWHARAKAVAEDKPILIFGTAGAGFNDPLGNC